MSPRWSRKAHAGAKAGVELACRHGCGATVLSFWDDEMGWVIQADLTPPAITADLADPDVRHRLWEYRGLYVGWVRLFQPERSWRPLRIQHDCAHTPATHKPRRTRPIPVVSEGNPVVHTTTTRNPSRTTTSEKGRAL